MSNRSQIFPEISFIEAQNSDEEAELEKITYLFINPPPKAPPSEPTSDCSERSSVEESVPEIDFDKIVADNEEPFNPTPLVQLQNGDVDSDKSPRIQPTIIIKKSKSPRVESPRVIEENKKSVSPRNPSPRPETNKPKKKKKKMNKNNNHTTSVEQFPVIDYIPKPKQIEGIKRSLPQPSQTVIQPIKRQRNEPIEPKEDGMEDDPKTTVFQLPKNDVKVIKKKKLNWKNQMKDVFDSTIYSTIILILILFESIIMGFYDIEQSPWKKFNCFVNVIDIVYQVYFTIEIILSIIIFKKQFFKSFSHVYILVLIILNWIPYISGEIDSNVNILNAFRFLRPLWLYLYLPGNEKIKLCMKKSVKNFISILLFGLLFSLIYGIIGVNLFNGKLNSNSGNNNNNPNYGLTSFDNIGSSIIIIFQYLIMDGWSDILYSIEYNYGYKGSSIYFIILLILSGYFFFNIFTVLFTTFYNNKFELNTTKDEVIERSKENEENNKTWKNEYKPIIVNQMKLKLLKLYKNGNEKIIDEEDYDIWKEELQISDADLIDKNNNEKENDNDIEIKKKNDNKENIKPESSQMSKSSNIYPISYNQTMNRTNTTNYIDDIESIKSMESTKTVREMSNKIANSLLFHIVMFIIIIFNIVTISMCKFDISEKMKDFTYYSDIVCTIIYTLETFLIIYSDSLYNYFINYMNDFDLLVLILCWIDVILHQNNVLNFIRMLKLIRYTQFWRYFYNYNLSILHTFKHIISYIFLLIVFIYSLAVIGYQLYGRNYNSKFDVLPQYNFNTMGDSIVSIFISVTKEKLFSLLYDSYHIEHWTSIIFFLIIIIFGILIVYQLFIAIIINGFRSKTKQISERTDDEGMYYDRILYNEDEINEIKKQKNISETNNKNEHEKNGKYSRKNILFQFHPSYKENSLFIFPSTKGIRKLFGPIALSPIFNSIVLIIIIYNIVVQCFNKPNLGSKTSDFIYYSNIVTLVIFIIETVIKVIAFGLIGHEGSYLRNFWNVLDFIINIIDIITVNRKCLYSDYNCRMLLSLRNITSLRLITHFHFLKTLFKVIYKSWQYYIITSLVTFYFYYCFAVLGMNLFGGKFYSCNNYNMTCYPFNNHNCGEDNVCIGNYTIENENKVEEENITMKWLNPSFSNSGNTYSFDSIGDSLLSVYEISTIDMSYDIMVNIMTVNEIGESPKSESNKWNSLYVFMVIIICNWFVKGLFIAVSIHSYSKCADRGYFGLLYNKFEDKQWIEIKDKMKKKKEKYYLLHHPFDLFSGFCIKIFLSLTYQIIMNVLIVIEFIFMLTYNYNMSNGYRQFLFILFCIYSGLFLIENIFKIASYRSIYFTKFWNYIELMIIVADIVQIALYRSDGNFIDFNIFRMYRLFKLANKIKYVNTFYLTVYYSFYHLGLMLLLFILFIMIYTTAGVQLFSNFYNNYNSFISPISNFNNWGKSMKMVLQIVFCEKWPGILHELISDSNNKGIKYLYFISATAITQFILIPLLISILYKNFEDLMKASKRQLSKKMYNNFRLTWFNVVVQNQQYFKNSNELHCYLLPKLLYDLKEPIGFSRKGCVTPSQMLRYIRLLNIPVDKDGYCNYVLVLRALFRFIIGGYLPPDVELEATTENVTIINKNHKIEEKISETATSFTAAEYIAVHMVLEKDYQKIHPFTKEFKIMKDISSYWKWKSIFY